MLAVIKLVVPALIHPITSGFNGIPIPRGERGLELRNAKENSIRFHPGHSKINDVLGGLMVIIFTFIDLPFSLLFYFIDAVDPRAERRGKRTGGEMQG